MTTELPLKFNVDHFGGKASSILDTALLAGGCCYMAEQPGDSLIFRFSPGALVGAAFISADFLLGGNHLAVFVLQLQEGEEGPVFGYSFGLLCQCLARLRMPLEAVNQNRWLFEREGALLKPRAEGSRVDLAKVDRMQLKVTHKSGLPVYWSMTPLTATVEVPPLITDPLLPKGVLLDELGQTAFSRWEGKSTSPQEVTDRLVEQLKAAPRQHLPADFTRWGGWKKRKVQATGFFRTHRDRKRWWLVDPEGHLFWSAGVDCVQVDTAAAFSGLESALTWLPNPNGSFKDAYRERGSTPLVNYLAANLIRAFGEKAWYEKWSIIALAELRRLGFNTVANWSDWQIASISSVPYVRPLPEIHRQLPCIYRDFPDVFHPEFDLFAHTFAEPLHESREDPAMIGYFLMNEPNWAFSQECPAAGMLFTSPSCHSRRALADHLRSKYHDDHALSSVWQINTTLAAVAEGEWLTPLTPDALLDLEDFSAVMVEKFLRTLSTACREVDPNHLNLGIRYYTVPPTWALAGMSHFDVFSMNCYRPRVPAEEMARVSALLKMPVIIGEWHFGALDVGLPASGIGHVPDQQSRGNAYRVYLEDAAVAPWCVGVHYFTLYDQSAIGRFDGENYNIGFLDVCNRPYEPLAAAARASHERLYPLANGNLEPFQEAPQYLPLLFM